MKKPLVAAMGLVLACGTAQAAEQVAADTSKAPELSTPDNTKVNKRDRDEKTLTPLDQSNSKEDLGITQAIRKSIMQQGLSVNAKNIKIITRNGEVTLRGPVNNTAEVEKIVEVAKAVQGIKSLNNQLEVK